MWVKRKWEGKSPSNVFLVSSLIFCGFLMALLSFRPKLNVGNNQLLMPSHFLYSFFPMFRVYARAGFFVSLCLAPLAGLGFAQFLSRKTKRVKLFCLTFFIGLLAIEYTVVPPVRNVGISDIKPFYQWIADQPGDFIVAEYPLSRSISLKHYQYLLAQRFHGKRLLNGAPEKTPLHWLIYSNKNLWENEVPKRLASLGVKYVVFHKEFFRENIHQRVLNVSGLKLIKDFPEVCIFEIIATPFDLFWIFGNSYPPRTDQSVQTWFDFAGDGAIVFYKRSLGEESYMIRFKIASFEKNQEVRILFQEKDFGKWSIASGMTQEVNMGKISLAQGLNTISLKVIPGIDSNRKISVAISDFEIIKREKQ
jgi:hypothetical protein